MVEVDMVASTATRLFGDQFYSFAHEKTGVILHRLRSYSLPSDIADIVQIVGGLVRLPEIQVSLQHTS